MFEPKSGGRLLNGKAFNRHILVQDGSGSIDHSTLCFWLAERSAKDMAEKLAVAAVPLAQALVELRDWAGRALGEDRPRHTGWEQVTGVWSNGAAADQPWLASAYARVGLPVPWDFRASRCCRTLFYLVDGPPEIDWTGLVPHDALDDAIGQAMQVQRALGMLGLDLDGPRGR